MSFLFIFVSLLLQVLTFAIFARAILSWISLSPTNPITVILNQITDPILAPLRRVVPRLGMIDITPLVAIVILQVLAEVLNRLV